MTALPRPARAGLTLLGVLLSALTALTLSTPATAAPATAPATAAPAVPAANQVQMFLGQDSDTLSDYQSQVVGVGAPQPAGVTLYTNLVEGGNPPPLAGMNGPVSWGAGTMDFRRTLSQFPNSALAVGLYLSDASTGCTNQPLRALLGRTDPDITPAMTARYRNDLTTMLNDFKGYQRTVYLRIGYEFDGPWNCYNAAYYIQAFQYIKNQIDALGATNVKTVWQSAAWPINTDTDHPEWDYIVTDPNHLNDWYPGDNYVDYVGLSDFYGSTYNQYQWTCGQQASEPPQTAQNTVLNFARSHGKKAMIAESAPQGFDNGNQNASCIFRNSPQPVSASTIWNTWYADYFNYIQQNSDVIAIASYINTDWNAQSQWQCNGQAGQSGCANGYWGNSAVQANPTILGDWINELKQPLWGGSGQGSGTGETTTPTGRQLLIGQSNTVPYQDFTSATGTDPAGGSVYYGVRDGNFSGQSGSSSQLAYANFLTGQRKSVEIGVSWKDDPPGWDGNSGDQEQAAQQATADIATGRYDSQFTALESYIAAHPASTFYLRLDYEVSTAFDCLNGNCNSYKNAFRHLVSLIDANTGGGANVQYVYHPVRGEFDQLYPGDDVVDWIGLSVFNQDLCQPYWENGTTYWNGTENTSTRTCSGYYDAIVNGNDNALPYDYPIDLNIIRMMWWAQQHGKPMILSESGVQRMAQNENTNGVQADSDYAAWANRLGTLLNYQGPIPNGVVDGQQTHFIGTGYDLSNVVKAVVFIDQDWRYGFDGPVGSNPGFEFPSTSGWFVNSEISNYPNGRSALCSVLATSGFGTTCT